MTEPVQSPVARPRPAFGRSLRAVAWSFFGVRKSADYERDVAELNPRHVIIAAVLAAVVFVLVLVGVVKWVLSSGIAAAT